MRENYNRFITFDADTMKFKVFVMKGNNITYYGSFEKYEDAESKNNMLPDNGNVDNYNVIAKNIRQLKSMI
jgi:hypothetical protein